MFYVDDYIDGAPSVEAAVVLREQLTELLAKGGFLIRKWCSNKLEALDGVPAHHLASLSSIAKLFDPLGLISPIIVTAKIFMQELALLHCGWDDPVPSEMAERWLTFYEKLEGLSELRIDRFAFISGWVSVQLHCFADASELAYGTCIYVRSVDCTGNVQVELLSSKSRVAPLKRLTIPRLELCAAKEAGMLYEKVSKSLSLDKIPAYFWSDSTIVLHWLKSPPNRWKTFVPNRVSSVQTSTYGHVWKHVSGKDNPADLVSRGMPVKEFIQSKLCRGGPEWLQDPNNWSKNGPDDSFTYEDLELRVSLPALAVSTQPDPLFYLRSSLNSLLRIVSYCLRFGHNTRFQAKHITGPLAVKEIGKAKRVLTHLAQYEHFAEEIRQLRKQQLVLKQSPLRLLNPYLDEEGIIRVGGRLRNSSIDYVTKHQAILPSHHPFTRILADTRQTSGQCSSTPMLSMLPCQPCKNTPTHRSTSRSTCSPQQAFFSYGRGLLWPFLFETPAQTRRSPKFYIAVFICIATKAIHLEMVSDLSTTGFLSALHRFIGRYGIPSQIHSDNATNFAGANNELKELYNLLSDKKARDQIHTDCSRQGIEWHFIPPRAPNFGGLWEAAVRSVKTSLKKQIGIQQLNYENFSTLLAQITAALNSRPLTPLSDDPSDMEAPTPAHFLTGTAMNTLPEPDYTHSSTSRLSHYQQRQQLFQQFWNRWTTEYLHNLQVINKQHQGRNINTGNIVVLIEDNQPPLQWPLARITELHPGSDGVVRVVTVKTRNGTYRRPVNKICPLPGEDVDQKTKPLVQWKKISN
ncbi:uncharacterized protein LOC129766687 [Toxorhynchites rutilus septentrionalis]|uniref:uncharacterized protein LOC129766687 n=1 Tax=Toxorhynchites rutilus septentrionalis TaxID=329112 RepID=UPI00247AB4EA|nr:uncharacterized protein LOC129766687 [Toxorhynchites rutilus septentrionalis]